MRIQVSQGKQQIHLVQKIQIDCAKHGRGRKAWWAERLGVSPMMLSHWLSGRRRPNADHIQSIQFALDELESLGQLGAWSDLLWQHHYDNRPFPGAALSQVAQQLVKSPSLETRLIALLSFFIESEHPVVPAPPPVAAWHNRLGWLFESAGITPEWDPSPLPSPSSFVRISGGSGFSQLLEQYLLEQRTELGIKWHLYDTDIARIKENLSWRKTRSAATA